jgi:hypothetical protein
MEGRHTYERGGTCPYCRASIAGLLLLPWMIAVVPSLVLSVLCSSGHSSLTDASVLLWSRSGDE